MRDKRVVVVADMHCGHRVGLTPPKWQQRPLDDVPQGEKWASIQAETWNWYSKTIRALAPIDLLIVNGDAIEGKGARSEGVELITADRSIQAAMAGAVIQEAQAATIRMTRGTPYHVGPGEDYENTVADAVGAKIGDHEWYTVNGVTMDVKHHTSGGTMPHTKHTSVMGDVLWNMIWADSEGQPDSDIFIRSHLHSYSYCMGIRPDQAAFVTPALQGLGSRFGARQCRKMVNVGFMSFDISAKGRWTWTAHLLSMKSQAAQSERL
jgi:hypothetical protein